MFNNSLYVFRNFRLDSVSARTYEIIKHIVWYIDGVKRERRVSGKKWWRTKKFEEERE